MEDSDEKNYDNLEKQEEKQKDKSLWTPLLNHQIFLLFWIGLIITNIGNSMQVIGSSWLMTTLTHSPFLIAMIQASTSLAVVLFTVPDRCSFRYFRPSQIPFVYQKLDAYCRSCSKHSYNI